MSDQSSQFVGSIPEKYDRCIGPYIFHEYAANLAARAVAAEPTDMLELASGTGILTRKLRDQLAPHARLVATDLNQPMLDVAASKFADGEQVDFQTADAMALPFDEGAFDLIACQFGVMFFPDKQVAFREAARVLRSGGRYLFNVWGSMAENPFSEKVHQIVTQFFPDDPPGFYKIPFGYADSSVVMADMEAAGLRDLTCETMSVNKGVDDWTGLAHGMVHGNPLIAEIQDRGGVNPDEIEQAILSGLREFFGSEPASMPLQASIYSATAP